MTPNRSKPEEVFNMELAKMVLRLLFWINNVNMEENPHG